MSRLRILLYVDSRVTFTHSLTAAELIRERLGAHITLMLVDSGNNFAEVMKNYEVYDLRILFRTQVPSRLWPKAAWIKDLLGCRAGLPIRRSALRPNFLVAAARRRARRYAHFSAAQRVLIPSLLVWIGGVRFTRFVFKKRDFWIKWLLDTQKQGTFIRQLCFLLLLRNRIDRFLDEVKPDAIVLAEDNVETLSTIFVAVAGKRSIPCIVIPFTIPNSNEPARYYLNNQLYRAKGPLARFVVWFWPKWLLRYEGTELLRQPAATALCQELMGFSSPAPWILNRGKAAAIALDSEAQSDIYLRMGFPRAQLRVIGDLNGALFHQILENKRQLTAELFGRHGLKPGRPLVLCGFPPDQYEGADSVGFEFLDYHALIKAWIRSFEDLGDRANVLIRPHPRVRADRLNVSLNSNIRLTWEPTAELIPLSNVYVAAASSTIRWAIACGTPVINYDTFRYRYDDFKAVAGVMPVESLDEFRKLLDAFLDDPAFAGRLVATQRSAMGYWGELDGKTDERLAALLLEAVAGTGRSRAVWHGPVQ